MDEHQHEAIAPTGSTLRPFFSVLFSILTILLGFAVVGQLAGVLIGSIFYDGTFAQWSAEFSDGIKLREELRIPLLWVQAVSTTAGLAAAPWFYLKFVEKSEPSAMFRKFTLPVAGLSMAAVVIGMVPNSVLIEWNSNLSFPGQWDNIIREREEAAMALTRFMTTFRHPGEFLIGILVIAVLPAFGEEIAFRGMLQPAMARFTGNIHIGIWVTAILFSAFHFQFLGFVPRVMLGVLFGYLAAWSGNLWLPILAHFANNAFSALFIYLHQLGISGLDPESAEAAPWIWVVPAVLALVFILMTIRKRSMTPSGKPDGAVQ